MLLLDSIFTDGNRVTGIRYISQDDFFLENGRYCTFMFLEMMAQTALFLSGTIGVPLLLAIRECTIYDLAYAGDELHISAVTSYSGESMGQANCKILSGEKLLAEGKILYCLKKAEET